MSAAQHYLNPCVLVNNNDRPTPLGPYFLPVLLPLTMPTGPKDGFPADEVRRFVAPLLMHDAHCPCSGQAHWNFCSVNSIWSAWFFQTKPPSAERISRDLYYTLRRVDFDSETEEKEERRDEQVLDRNCDNHVDFGCDREPCHLLWSSN
jgi:hypothetical protein